MEDHSLLNTDLPVPERILSGINRSTRHIGATGAMLSGQQRIQVAQAARAAATGGQSSVAAGVLESTAAKIATHAHGLSAPDVEAFDNPGTYVEVLSVVARTMAIDTTTRGIGATEIVLPAGSIEEPTGDINPAAKQRSALVPVVGAAGPTSALSLLPSEDYAQEDLHGALYLSYREMGDLKIHKELPRWQLELVAARTSLINNCFF